MDLFDCISQRRSIRKYLKKHVEWEKVGRIIDAGRLAPSSGNIQDWQFLVVDNEHKRHAIAEASLEQSWMADAPIQIVICCITMHGRQMYGMRGERLYSIQNCAAAVENMLLAATDLGLGSCWVGAFDEDKVCHILGIPERARPQAIITIGYAAEHLDMPQKKSLENVTFMNKYGENSGRIRDIDYTMGDTSKIVHETAEKGLNFLSSINRRLMKKR